MHIIVRKRLFTTSKNCNNTKNELISNNNKLTVENKQLQENYNSISTIKDNECKEKIQNEK